MELDDGLKSCFSQKNLGKKSLNQHQTANRFLGINGGIFLVTAERKADGKQAS
jgi:hypothetical protein